MNNNDDYESDVSSLDTHFRERDGDEDNLWEVEAIVAERGSRYQVRWAGVDDKGAPWPLDWVPKEDCTDPLVRKWKKQKARKRKRDEKISETPYYHSWTLYKIILLLLLLLLQQTSQGYAW